MVFAVFWGGKNKKMLNIHCCFLSATIRIVKILVFAWYQNCQALAPMCNCHLQCSHLEMVASSYGSAPIAQALLVIEHHLDRLLLSPPCPKPSHAAGITRRPRR